MLVQNPSPEAIRALLLLLESRDREVKGVSALTLRGIGDERAVLPLLKEIKKNENINHRETLVYSLGTLDCSDHFMEIFELAFSDKAMVYVSAMYILFNQEFCIDENELERAFLMLEQRKESVINYKDLK